MQSRKLFKRCGSWRAYDRATQVPVELLEVEELREACALSEESAYTESELEAYHQYWDLVSRERTLTVGYEEKGRVQGRAEGKVEGQLTEKITIAKNLLGLGLESNKIAQATGLSVQDIEKLSDEP